MGGDGMQIKVCSLSAAPVASSNIHPPLIEAIRSSRSFRGVSGQTDWF